MFENAALRPATTPSPPRPPPPEIAPPVVLLGVPLDHVTLAAAVTRIRQMVTSRQPHYVVTANVDFLVQALRDVELRRVLMDADLALCDGMPLVWASRLLGNPLPERVAGADLVPRLIQCAADNQYRVYFLGGAPAVTARAVANLQTEHPRLIVAGYHSPPFRALHEMDHEDICRRIRAAKPDLLLVSFGCPKAEKWMAMHYRSLDVPVLVGVGGTIDFLAGQLKRAPLWMQRTGLEWVFRLAQEPRRLFRRYVTDLWFFGGALLRQWWHMPGRARRVPNPSAATVALVEPTWQRVRAPECLDAAAARRNQPVWEAIPPRHWLLELDGVRFIDSTGVGLLVGLQKRLRITGHELVLLAPSRTVRRALKLMRLQDFFVVADDASEAHRLIARPDPVSPDGEGEPLPFSQPLCWLGEVTAANAEQVWCRTQAQIRTAAPQTDRLVVDLSAVPFIDCSGLGVMVRAKEFAAQHQVALRFAGAHPNVRNVLRLVRLETDLLEEPT